MPTPATDPTMTGTARTCSLPMSSAWTDAHGKHFHGTVLLDKPTEVDCYHYTIAGTDVLGWVIVGPMSWPMGTEAVYLMDDGVSVEAFYVAAYHPGGEHVIAHPMSTLAGQQFTPKLAYHIKLSKGNS